MISIKLPKCVADALRYYAHLENFRVEMDYDDDEDFDFLAWAAADGAKMRAVQDALKRGKMNAEDAIRALSHKRMLQTLCVG